MIDNSGLFLVALSFSGDPDRELLPAACTPAVCCFFPLWRCVGSFFMFVLAGSRSARESLGGNFLPPPGGATIFCSRFELH